MIVLFEDIDFHFSNRWLSQGLKINLCICFCFSGGKRRRTFFSFGRSDGFFSIFYWFWSGLYFKVPFFYSVALCHVWLSQLLLFRYLSCHFSPFPLSRYDIFPGKMTAVLLSFLLLWCKTCKSHGNNDFEVLFCPLDSLELIFSCRWCYQ